MSAPRTLRAAGRPRCGRIARTLGLLAIAAALPGCTGLPPGGGEPAAHEAAGADSPVFTERQLMVTLAPVPPPVLAQRAAELALAYRLRSLLSWPLASLNEPCIVFEVTGNRSPADVARRMATDPRVRSVQPIQVFETFGADAARDGEDPYAHLQHGAQELRLADAHRHATGKGVRVAVVDTGIDLDHPDLRGRIVKASNFVDRGEGTFTSDIHGTAVAGVLAAAAGNDVGIVGVAPQAELLALKACWPRAPGTRQALCNSYTLAKAIDAAIAERAQVLNLSLGGPADPLLARLVHAALERGIAVVGAVGAGEAGFPAAVDGVIAVEGSGIPGGPREARAGGGTELSAPGADILTTVPRGAYDFFTGSSFAAAEVSGVAALLLEKNPHLTPGQVKELIERSARAVPAGEDPPGDPRRVDACAAVALVSGERCP